MKTKITQNLVNQIEFLTNQRYSNREIAIKLELKLSTINNTKYKYKIKSYSGLINDPVFINYIRSNYLIENFKIISKKFNCSRYVVERTVKRLKLPYNQYLKIQRTKTNVFLPRTSESDYWLGFLLADGYIHDKIELTLSLSDREHLQKFSLFTSTPIIDFKYYCRVVLFHNETCKYLESLGFSNKKTFVGSLSIPLTYDILRGIIDGDGCITKNSINISSSNSDIVKYIVDFFVSEKVQFHLRTTLPEQKKGLTKPHYTICISICRNRMLFDKLYNKNCVKLDRKYLKWVSRIVKSTKNTVNSGKP